MISTQSIYIHTMRIRQKLGATSSAYINQVGKEIKNGIWLIA